MSEVRTISSLTIVPNESVPVKPLLSVEEKKFLDLLIKGVVEMASKQNGKLGILKPANK